MITIGSGTGMGVRCLSPRKYGAGGDQRLFTTPSLPCTLARGGGRGSFEDVRRGRSVPVAA